MPNNSPGDHVVSSEEQLIIRQYNGPIPPASELQQLKGIETGAVTAIISGIVPIIISALSNLKKK